jgi:putative aldouronate transport system substrate-binding protein
MQQRKWWAVPLTVTLLGTSVLAGCGSNKESGGVSESASPSTAAAASKAPSAPIKIEMLKEGGSSTVPADDFVKKELNKKLNIDFSLNLIASAPDLENKLNVLAASNNLPDLFETKNKVVYQQLAKNGLLLDLEPYMGQLAGLKKLIGDDGFTKGKVNGKVYGFSRTPGINPQHYWIRKDWLEALGLKMPTNPQELLEVAKAFAEKDPDGNGKKDTFGITGENRFIFAPLFGTFAMSSVPDHFYEKNGKVINTLYDPDMKKALELVAKFVQTPGAVDPEFSSAKLTTAMDKAFKGQAGIYYDQWASIMKDDQVKTWKNANPKAEWVILPPFQGTQANYVRSANVGPNGYIAIPKRLEKEKDKLNKIFELLNTVSDGEGLSLVQYGLKDVHWKLENGKAVLTEKATEANYTWLYQITGRPEMEYLSTKFAKQAPYIQEAVKMPELKNYSLFVDIPEGYVAADATRFILEEMLKFYMGKTPIADYDKFLNTLETKFNYKKLTEQADKQLKELGYAK